ncbi:MAG: hypothetical protein JKY26_01565 [Pseudomonas sp.]|nr:hypothetical protein [Pseudomonas sp.]
MSAVLLQVWLGGFLYKPEALTMSKIKIEAALKRKGITAKNIEYQHSCPVPEGLASGWDIEFSEEMEYLVWAADESCGFSTFEEFDSLNSALNWIKKLPIIKPA